MTDPTPSRQLSDAEIERRLAELEASIAAEAPKTPPPAPEPIIPEPEIVTPREPVAPAEAPRRASARKAEEIGGKIAEAMPSMGTVSDTIAESQLVTRALGIARFSRRTYEEVAGSGLATIQAAEVVALVAVVSGIGALAAGLGGFVTGVIWALIKWGLFTISAWIVATRLFDTKPQHDVTALARVLGFAQFPGVLAIVGFIPFLGWSLAAVGNLWVILAVMMGLRYILKLDFRQAILTSLGAWLLSTALAAGIGTLLGVHLSRIF